MIKDINMRNRICLVYNYAQHYRTNIFCLLEKEFSIDFVFGDKYLDVKKMNYSILQNFKKEVKNIRLFKTSLTFQTGVLTLLKEYKTFIILGDLHSVSTWLMLILAKVFRKDIYLWSHGWYGRESIYKIVLKKLFFGLAKGTFLYGNYAKNLMISNGFNPKKLHVIHNSLMYQEQIELRNKAKSNSVYNDHFNNINTNLIFLGRLTKQKRLDLLIHAIAKLKSEGSYYNLTIIGDGIVKQSLMDLSKEMGLSNCIWFYGDCYDESILASLIYNADLCVSPGNVGLTAIHSLTFGTPVVTHNKFTMQGPEFETIKKGETGGFFEYNSVGSLSNTIRNWFLENKDRDKIRLKCYETIDDKWNPFYQIKVFKSVLR